MTDIEFRKMYNKDISYEVGVWLDTHMTNPPLPEPQRWSIIDMPSKHPGIRFADEKDATVFMLRWS